MTSKINPKKIVEAMKEAAKLAKAKKPEPKVESKPVAPPSGIRVRDMRQEAMDLGSHGSEAFKEGQSNGPV